MGRPEQQFASRLQQNKVSDKNKPLSHAPTRPHQSTHRPRGATADDRRRTSRLLNDPFARFVLRRGLFPGTLTEVLAAVDSHDADPDGLPETASYLISEGGQIPFEPGVSKGGSRLLVARSRGGTPEIIISTLVPPGVGPREPGLLIEVLGWDPVNKTFHFYQREGGA